jgi:DNA-binding winged helix-turn-helix (wHTH) protein
VRYLFGSCLLDTQRYELYREHVRVPLRSTVLDILAYLITYRDRLVYRDELLAHVWPDQPPSMHPTVLDACLLEARRAIGDSGQAQQMIRNLRGQGYRFIAPVQARIRARPGP